MIETQDTTSKSTGQDLINGGPSIAVPLSNAEAVGVKRVKDPEASDEHLQFADFQQEYISTYIQLADTKAGVTLTIASGLLAYLFSKDQFVKIILGHVWGWPFVFASCSLIFLLVAAALSLGVVVPRQRSSEERGIVYWGGVADFSNAGAYVTEVIGTNSSELIGARLVHVYDIARICAAKYKWVRRAMLLGAIGALMSLGAVFSL